TTVFEDITERKLAEKELLEGQALLEASILQSPIPMTMINPDGTLRIYNQAILDLLGLKGEDINSIKGTPAAKSAVNFELFDEQDQLIPNKARFWKRAAEGKAVKGKLTKIVRADGSARWFSGQIVPINGKNGDFLAGLIIAPDITEQVQARKAIQDQKDLLQKIVDSIPAYVSLKDTNSRFLLINRGQKDFLGLSTWEESLNKTDHDFFPGFLAEKYYKDEQEIVRTGKPLLAVEEETTDRASNTKWTLSTKVP
ncbi:MAG: PAS domain S-box protein, partial [Patescibacteria group bacterium]